MQKKDRKGEKNLKIHKLVLSKETLGLLSGRDMEAVVGGMPPISKDTDCDNPYCWGNPTTSDAC